MKVNSVNNNPHAACQNRPQNFGAFKVNAKALDCLKLFDESHIPGSLRFLLNAMEQEGAIAPVSHNAYKSLLGENDVILSRNDINALRIAVKESDADTTIHRFAAARFFDLGALFPNGRQSVVETCKAKIKQGIIKAHEIPKAIKELRAKIFQEANLAPIASIKNDFKSEVPTKQGIPFPEVEVISAAG